MSTRHSSADPGRAPEDVILDAALATALAVGFKRLTVTEVARRAGVSRMTAYRRFADNSSLTRALMTREFTKLLAQTYSQVAAGAGSHGEQLVELLVTAAQTLPEHPLFRKTLEVDPELLLPYLVDHLGSTQRLASDAIATLLAAAVSEGSVQVDDPASTATLLLLMTQSLVISRQLLDDEGALDGVIAAWRRMAAAALGVTTEVRS